MDRERVSDANLKTKKILHKSEYFGREGGPLTTCLVVEINVQLKSYFKDIKMNVWPRG